MAPSLVRYIVPPDERRDALLRSSALSREKHGEREGVPVSTARGTFVTGTPLLHTPRARGVSPKASELVVGLKGKSHTEREREGEHHMKQQHLWRGRPQPVAQ